MIISENNITNFLSLKVHIVWSTKFRYKLLREDIKLGCRSILMQVYESEDILILKEIIQVIIYT